MKSIIASSITASGEHMKHWNQNWEKLFDKLFPVVNTLNSYFGFWEKFLVISFKQNIFEAFIDRLFFKPEDCCEDSHFRELSLLQPSIFGGNHSGCTATIQNLLQFQLWFSIFLMNYSSAILMLSCSQPSSLLESIISLLYRTQHCQLFLSLLLQSICQ